MSFVDGTAITLRYDSICQVLYKSKTSKQRAGNIQLANRHFYIHLGGVIIMLEKLITEKNLNCESIA